MRIRGELGDEVTLEKGNAAVYKLHVDYSPIPNPRPGILLLVFSLALAGVGLIRRSQTP